jgi:hypothetical protein
VNVYVNSWYTCRVWVCVWVCVLYETFCLFAFLHNFASQTIFASHFLLFFNFCIFRRHPIAGIRPNLLHNFRWPQCFRCANSWHVWSKRFICCYFCICALRVTIMHDTKLLCMILLQRILEIWVGNCYLSECLVLLTTLDNNTTTFSFVYSRSFVVSLFLCSTTSNYSLLRISTWCRHCVN